MDNSKPKVSPANNVQRTQLVVALVVGIVAIIAQWDKLQSFVENLQRGGLVTVLCLVVFVILFASALWNRVNQIHAEMREELAEALVELRSARQAIKAIEDRDAGAWKGYWDGLDARIDTAKKELEGQYKQAVTTAIVSIERDYHRLLTKPGDEKK